MNKPRYPDIVAFGRQGAGKGEQGKMLEDLQYQHVSIGEELRKQRKAGTDIGNKAQSFIDAGGLVPDKLVMQLVNEHADDSLNLDHPIYWDGFPRSPSQIPLFKNFMETRGRLIEVVLFDLSEDEAVRRIVSRGREDDKDPEVVRKRLETFKTDTQPVIDIYLADETLSVLQIDASKSIVDVAQEVRRRLSLPEMSHA